MFDTTPTLDPSRIEDDNIEHEHEHMHLTFKQMIRTAAISVHLSADHADYTSQSYYELI